MPTNKEGRNNYDEDTPKLDQTKPTNIREKFLEQQLATEKKLSLWLWIGVGGLGFVIVFFWGYSLWSNMSSYNWRKSQESKIFKQSSADLSKIFDENKENQLRNQLNIKQIKELLKQNFATTTILTSTTNKIDFTTTTTSTLITTSTIATTTKK